MFGQIKMAIQILNCGGITAGEAELDYFTEYFISIPPKPVICLSFLFYKFSEFISIIG